MPNTYTFISSVTVGAGGAASMAFSSIPSTYTDLKVVVSAKQSGAGSWGLVYIYPNSATTSLSSRILYGYGTGVGSAAYTSAQSIWGYIDGPSATSNTFGNTEFYLTNYSSTSAYKAISADSVNENNTTDARQSLTAGLWSSNSAITSLTLSAKDSADASANFAQYSTAYLYGIKKS